MNPESFIITVSVSLAIGMLIGYFAREVFHAICRAVHDLYATPKRLKRFHAPTSNRQDSSTE
ncbi:hypothetical protein FHR99_001206 [Litorivivens lipolytica]|uniref:Uncharacterized protein n=1 Tax=Litorivivens lipolytica TaxID=1524264 RepID=A0A7W4Z6I1_9GAMM|nr:hypothetical protein [Litorivivens lipolytica]